MTVRASESRVGVFYVRFEDDQFGNNDYIIVRIVDKSKTNSSLYSLHLARNGAVSIHLSKLEPARNGQDGQLNQAEMRKVSVNTELSFGKSQYQGFWVAVRNGIDISIGRIGDKIIESVANYSDIIREGPDNPYYFGLTVSETTSADFGVNCDMPGATCNMMRPMMMMMILMNVQGYIFPTRVSLTTTARSFLTRCVTLSPSTPGWTQARGDFPSPAGARATVC